MAQVTPLSPLESFASATPTASDPAAGDRIQVGNGQRDLTIFFENAHTSAITTTVTAQTTSATVDRLGNVTKSNLSLSIGANTGRAVLFIPASALPAYIDSSGFVNIAYTSGNAALRFVAVLA